MSEDHDFKIQCLIDLRAWDSKGRGQIPIEAMATPHLNNAINKLKSDPDDPRQPLLPILLQEAKARRQGGTMIGKGSNLKVDLTKNN